MNGNLMYEMARQRLTEQQRTARQAGEARGRRATARGRRAPAATAPVLPPIPDYAHELLGRAAGDGTAGETSPAPRPEAGHGRPARSGR